MKIKFYGTRGSTPISNKDSVIYGGNTSCIRVFSECIPEGTLFAVDAGSGFVPLTSDAIKEGGIKEVIVAYTHYHHDHTQGLFLSPYLFIKSVKLKLIGPIDTSVGPKQMMEHLMRPPFFPVHLKEVESHLEYEGFEFPPTVVIIFHKLGGNTIINKKEYENIVNTTKQINIGGNNYDIFECLVITMHKSHHPEQTVSYRFDELPTGKSFVFLTDHENEDGISSSLKSHLEGIDFLAIDSQYTREKYEKHTAGFGHGTPDYCARLSKELGIKKLGLTHHDPASKDTDIENILNTAIEFIDDTSFDVFAIKDYDEVEV